VSCNRHCTTAHRHVRPAIHEQTIVRNGRNGLGYTSSAVEALGRESPVATARGASACARAAEVPSRLIMVKVYYSMRSEGDVSWTCTRVGSEGLLRADCERLCPRANQRKPAAVHCIGGDAVLWVAAESPRLGREGERIGAHPTPRHATRRRVRKSTSSLFAQHPKVTSGAQATPRFDPRNV
jgi:hypothetical protein